MKKRLAALICCMLLVLQMAAPSARAAETVYFVVAGVDVQPVSDQTMPFWSGGYLYIPSSLFTSSKKRSTLSKLSRGSPTPIITTCEILIFISFCAV